MAREVKSRPTARQQVQGTPASTGLQVVARQVNTVVDPGTNTGTTLLAALSQVRPQLQQFIDTKQAETNTAETLKGESARMTLGDVERSIALGNIKREQSPFFQSGYMKMHGKLEARKFQNDLEEALSDPEQFNSDVDDIGAFTRSKLDESLKGMDDQDFLASYLPHAEQVVAAAKTRFVAGKSAEVIEKAQNGTFALMTDAAADATRAGRSLTKEERDTLYTEGRKLGIPYRKQDELLFEAVKVQALSGDGHPEALDIFNERSTDGTQAGMAHSAVWADKIRALRHQAGQLQHAAREKKDHVLRLQTWDEMNTLVNTSGQDPKVLLNTLIGHVKAGRMTEGESHGIINQNTETLKFNASVKQVVSGLRARNLDGSAGVPKKIMDAGIEKMDAEIQERAGDNASAYVGEAMQVFAANNVIPERLKHRLNNANPLSNPDAFHKSAELFMQFSARDPNYIQRHVESNQTLIYGAYRDAIEFDGASKEQALRIAAEVSDPESHKRLAALMTPETRAKIGATASTVVGNGWGADAKNSAYVQDTVDRMMTSYLLRRRGSVGSAAQWAEERFKATHTMIADRWLPTEGQPNSPLAHPQFGEAATFAAQKYADMLKAAGKNVPEDGFYIAPDFMTRADGTYGVFRNGNSLASEGIRVNPDVILQDYLKVARGKHVTWKEIQAAQSENTAPLPLPDLHMEP